MRRVLDKRYLLIVTVLLLQLGIGETLYAAEPPSHLADVTMAAMHLHDCGSGECPTGDCPLQQCNTGASPACRCSCAQIPLLAAGDVTLDVTSPATASVGNSPDPARWGLDMPFRPPA